MDDLDDLLSTLVTPPPQRAPAQINTTDFDDDLESLMKDLGIPSSSSSPKPSSSPNPSTSAEDPELDHLISTLGTPQLQTQQQPKPQQTKQPQQPPQKKSEKDEELDRLVSALAGKVGVKSPTSTVGVTPDELSELDDLMENSKKPTQENIVSPEDDLDALMNSLNFDQPPSHQQRANPGIAPAQPTVPRGGSAIPRNQLPTSTPPSSVAVGAAQGGAVPPVVSGSGRGRGGGPASSNVGSPATGIGARGGGFSTSASPAPGTVGAGAWRGGAGAGTPQMGGRGGSDVATPAVGRGASGIGATTMSGRGAPDIGPTAVGGRGGSGIASPAMGARGGSGIASAAMGARGGSGIASPAMGARGGSDIGAPTMGARGGSGVTSPGVGARGGSGVGSPGMGARGGPVGSPGMGARGGPVGSPGMGARGGSGIGSPGVGGRGGSDMGTPALGGRGGPGIGTPALGGRGGPGIGGPAIVGATDDINNMLAGLTDSMNSLDGSTGPARGICASCGRPIFGEVIQAQSKVFHPEHFVCGNCQVELGTRNFFEQQGVPYCELCFQQLYCPRCAYCSEPLLDRCITALGQNWHVDHFLCFSCGQGFPTGNFFEKEQKPYCEACFFSSYGPKCVVCNQPIRGDCVNALGQQWHPEHFVCTFCQQPFKGGTFFEKNGKPYCESHYLLEQQPAKQFGGAAGGGSLICNGCRKPITTGQAVDGLGFKWHPEHFICAYCLNPLHQGNWYEHQGKAYCNTCSF